MTTLNKMETWEVETLVEDKLARLHKRCTVNKNTEERKEFYAYYKNEFDLLEKILDKCRK